MSRTRVSMTTSEFEFENATETSSDYEEINTGKENEMNKNMESLRSATSGLKKAKGMTLVEIMIVITIMASVMGVVGFFVFGALDRANARTAEVEIQQLKQMVNNYYLTSTPQRLPDSLHDLTEGPAPLTQEVPTDPWGNDYIYLRHSNREFEIFSVGADGVQGTEDDVRVD